MIGALVFVLFIALPLLELVLLIYIGRLIGFWYTVAIVIATGVIGAVLARLQGTRAWRDVLGAWSEGRVPGVELAAGALFLVGAAFLLTPGVITDTLGFLLMVPFVRRAAARGLIGRFRGRARVRVHVGGVPGRREAPGGVRADDAEPPRVVRSRRVDDEH